MLRLGVKLPAAGDFADFDAALVGLIGGDEKIERRARDVFSSTPSALAIWSSVAGSSAA